MVCMENLLDALEEVGEASAFYKEDRIVMANERFATIFEKSPEECRELPINDIFHEESIDMVRDFIRRRKHGDPDVPRSYSASFRNSDDDKMEMKVTVLEPENTGGAYLAILAKRDRD